MLIDYDRAAADYEASLVTKLRGHGAGSFLENWVPDPDPALGIVNMIEAAWTDGRDQLELAVGRKTLDAAGLERLKGLAAQIAEIVITPSGEQNRLQVRRANNRANSVKQTAAATRAKATVARHAQEPTQKKEATPELEPVLAEALKAETASFTHEGGNSAGVSLTVGEDDIIRTARHAQVKPDTRRRLAELMCREIEGRTVQDASDHAAVLVIHRLYKRAGTRPASGILLPANAGTEVVAALELVRSACRSHQEQSGRARKPNFFERGPSDAWAALPPPDKQRKAAQALDAFCRSEGRPSATARVAQVEKDIHGHEIRVIIQVDGNATAEGVPFFLRRLERYLKTNLEGTLQVYLEPWKDKNVLRRL